jgi:type VI secretion system protein ImpJ
MSPNSPVVWSQGMFLMPHHFQQEARHVEYLLDMRVRAAGPLAWGFFDLALDEGLLATGQVAISRASGVLPDGTPFSIPHHDHPPPVLEVPPDMKNELVCLALPRARSGLTQVAFDGADVNSPCRWRVESGELRDITNAADDPEPVQTGALALKLVRAKDAGEGHAALGVVRVTECRSDHQVMLDRDYIAPQTRIDASQQLSSQASLLHGLIRQRAVALAARFGQLSHGVSEMADFLMLQALNRAEPLFRQLALAPQAHPWELHRICLQLAGDLATFTTDARHAAEHPLYDHDDLKGCFAPLIADLRRMLSAVIDRNAVQIELAERDHGVHLAVFPNAELVRMSNLVLAVNAQLPAEQLRTRFTARSKLGPADRLRDLVNLNLPGIALRLLPTAPRQLPFHAGFHYFELDRGGELWKQLERSGSLALHVAGEFPSLELELWAVRQ